jgi:hypothetical protein
MNRGRFIAGDNQVGSGVQHGGFHGAHRPGDAIEVPPMDGIRQQQRMAAWAPDADAKAGGSQRKAKARAHRPGLSGQQQYVRLRSSFR